MVEIYYESVEMIDDTFKDIDKIIEDSWKNIEYRFKDQLYEVKRYLSHAKRTPLPLSSEFGCFERWCKFTPERNKINIYSFNKKVSELGFLPGELSHLIIDIAKQYSKRHLMIEHLEKKVIEYKGFKKIIIVHKNDEKDLKIILNKNGFDDCFVCNWQGLERIIESLQNEEFITIAIEPPAMGDDLFVNLQKQIIFISNQEIIEIVKNLIENMEIGKGYYPIHYILNEKDGPELLYSIEKVMLEEQKEKKPTPLFREKLDNIRDWHIKEILRPSDRYYGSDVSDKTKISRETTVIGIRGQEVVVVINKRDLKCIIFPLHASVFMSGEADPIEAQKIIGKTPTKISISKKNISIKVQFAEWLVNEYDIGSLERRQFVWESFTDLLQDSVLWIDVLKESKILYGGSNELAIKIQQSGTSAQDLWYIPHWWESFEGTIFTPTGEEIQIPSIEHPFRKQDLMKIANAINNENLRKQVDRVWEATLEIQNQRRRFIKAAHSYANLREGLEGSSEEELEEELIKILDSNELPEFFSDLMDEFESFEVQEARKIKLDKELPLYKILDLKDVFE